MRLSKNDLKEVVKNINNLIGKDYVVGHWNGYYHVYTHSNGEGLISGTLRECYNYCIAFKHGIRVAFKSEM